MHKNQKDFFRHAHAAVAAMLATGTLVPQSLRDFLPRRPKKPGSYIPGGPNQNVRGCRIRNPKIAADINKGFEKWACKRDWYHQPSHHAQ